MSGKVISRSIYDRLQEQNADLVRDKVAIAARVEVLEAALAKMLQHLAPEGPAMLTDPAYRFYYEMRAILEAAAWQK
jgi:hypothetical protein